MDPSAWDVVKGVQWE